MTTAEIEELIRKHINPTGVNHTPTPWRADTRASHNCITTETGSFLAYFRRIEDRDLALYFVNCHVAIISLLRQHADQFDFIAQGADDEGTRQFARDRADTARIYADLFTRLGKPEKEEVT